VSEQDTPPSGSRWEPTPGQPDDTPTSELAAHPAPPVPLPEALPEAETLDSETAPVQPSSRRRGRAAMAGAGLALLLGGGLGGFAIGHAAGGDAGGGDRHGFGGQAPQGVPGGGYGPGQDGGTGSATGGTGSSGSAT
jgi:hypothetical protein